MAVEYTVYVNIEAYDPSKRYTAEDDCWHPSEEVDLAKLDNLKEAELFVEALQKESPNDQNTNN